MNRHATASEARELVACGAAYCRAAVGQRCKSVLGKPMDACHWVRIQAAGIHLISIDPPVEPNTGPKAEEQTPEYIRARRALKGITTTKEKH